LLSWLTDILWSLWAGVSTVGSVILLLAAGLALFGLFIGLPHVIRQRRLRRLTAQSLEAVPASLRAHVLHRSREIGGFPPSETILASTPGLRQQLSGFGVPPERLIDLLLAHEAPLVEPDPEEPDPGILQ
jgi:hypothetical protein